MLRQLLTISKPLLIGCLAYITCSIFLWYWIGFLIVPLGEQFVLLLPILSILPSLVFGGYLTGQFAHPYQIQYGFVVGCLCFLFTQAMSFKPGPDIGWLFTAALIGFMVLAGGITSALGGWLSKRHASRSNHHSMNQHNNSS